MSLTKIWLHDYNEKLDAAWLHMEQSITALIDLNETVWLDDDNHAEVPRADALLLQAKVREIMEKCQEFTAAAPAGRTVQLPNLATTA